MTGPDATNAATRDAVARLTKSTFIRQAQWHDELASTNTTALELAADGGLVTPFMIGATRQRAGRGRGANSWWAGDGSLLVSVLFDMPALGLAQVQWPRFSLGTALATRSISARTWRAAL